MVSGARTRSPLRSFVVVNAAYWGRGVPVGTRATFGGLLNLGNEAFVLCMPLQRGWEGFRAD